MSLDILKEDIDKKAFRRIYYIYGEENYLKRFYLGELKKAVIPPEAEVDMFIAEGKGLSVESFSDFLESYPKAAEKKLMIIKDLPQNSPVAKYIAENPGDLNDDTIVVLFGAAEKFDERTKDYKVLKKVLEEYGTIACIDLPDDKLLERWVIQQFRKRQRIISADNASYMLFSAEKNMDFLLNEMDKLAAYCEKEITKAAIDLLVIKTVQARVFELNDAITEKDSDKALTILNKLFLLKTPVQLVLGVLFSHISTLYKVKLLESGNTGEIADLLGMKEYPVKKALSAVRKMNITALEKCIDCCVKADLASKSTATDDEVILVRLVTELIFAL